MRIFPLHNRSVLLSILLLGAFAPSLTGEPVTDGANTPGGVRTIGPGKVSLQMGPNGRWLSFTPEWTGRSLLSGGGLVLYAEDSEGPLSEIASTRRGLKARDGVPTAAYHEGVAGGFRAPSVNADDDSDGRVNEDRVDGIDNDDDGRIDEDFAAVGDQMIVSEFRTPLHVGPSALGQVGPVSLEFHQEVYAWSLPHIDSAVMFNVWIKNTGYGALYNVHVGVFIEKPAPFTYTERTTTDLASQTESIAGGAVVLGDAALDGGTSLALIGLAATGVADNAATWSGGHVRDADEMIEAARSQAAAAKPEVDPAVGPYAGQGALDSPVAGPPRQQQVETDITGEDNAYVFNITPRIASIEPGQEVLVQFALVAIGPGGDVDNAISLALRTYAGDGVHRFLPPPVSMTPRTLWGTYYPVGGEAPGVAIEIDALGDDPVRAEQISYLSGIASEYVERSEVRPGQPQLVLRGEPANKMLEDEDRVKLKGRLATGEFFEANLRPVSGESLITSPGTGKDADQFWSTSGKLDDVLDDRIELLQSTPNPFRDATTIHYEVPKLVEQKNGITLRTNGPLNTSVKIYNVRGRLVTTLVDEQLPPGIFTVGWNGADDFGTVMPSGVYFIKLQIGQKFITQRATLVR